MANISELKFDDKNFNQHTEYGMSLLEKSLRENGAGRSILIDKDNNIIAGNGIIEAAGNIGLEDLQIVETDGSKIVAVKRTDIALDSRQGREMALADNATAAVDLSWNEDAIREQADKWGFDANDWGQLFKPHVEITEDDPDDIDEENTYSVVGNIYQLGEHRVYCGSFEDDDKMRGLFGGLKATCTFTDPPYNVAVKSRSTGKTIKNDNMKADDFQLFLNHAFECVASNMVTGGGVISWMSDQEILTLKSAMDQAGLRFRTVLCWVKDHFTLGGNDFQSAKELAIYGIGEGKFERSDDDEADESEYAIYARGHDGKFTNVRSLSNVWFFDKPKKSLEHPTMKPVGLCAKGILAMSGPKDIVFDPFLGSGSTLVACEQTGRRCFGCELDPKYCDVIRKRWWKLTHDGNEEGWQEGTPAI
jgi:DNA modification methylase